MLTNDFVKFLAVRTPINLFFMCNTFTSVTHTQNINGIYAQHGPIVLYV